MKINRIVIVTGGNGLLGRSIISKLEFSGFSVINFDINNKTDLSKKLIHCDVTSPESIEIALKLTTDAYGQIFGLVNNAYPRTPDWGTPFEKLSPESWKQNIDMQLNSVFYLTKEVLLHMKKFKEGSVVNMSSIYGVVGHDFSLYENTKISTPAPYSAIKGGLNNFTRYLSSLFGPEQIRINCVSPGGIFDNQDPIFVSNYIKRVPLGRMGNPDDISGVVNFLISDDSKYITGQNIIVDGGYTSI